MWAVPGLPLKLWRRCYSTRASKQVQSLPEAAEQHARVVAAEAKGV